MGDPRDITDNLVGNLMRQRLATDIVNLTKLTLLQRQPVDANLGQSAPDGEVTSQRLQRGAHLQLTVTIFQPAPEISERSSRMTCLVGRAGAFPS